MTNYFSVGKSHFICDLIKHRDILFTSKFCRIIYCQPESLIGPNEIFNKLKEEYPQVELHRGLPSVSKLHLDINNLPSLLILDDLMQAVLDSSEMVDLFAIHVHHNNISVIFSSQHYYLQSRYCRTIMRNIHYKVFFYNRLELVELRNISNQIMPSAPDFMLSNFKFLEKTFPNQFSHYILVDGHVHSKMSQLHIRSQILPNEKNEINPVIFSPNPDYKKDCRK
jgi:hypothetical protein